ncbi:MAG: Heme exporter protein C [Alphaproteobacteria bacterium MarineAlpha5_Bin5]|nr:MAG: Heme exporter protein C [Alphaproteobacteria bacterium MarineAlpha5_Bin4]PPR50163.1 MAG: Heme exporter protein C [Alphaproteobacteria bacterium MarineAlpha5_Bin5]|tara:strand:- start:373 stop:1068 length:696 start_codon:yes stop_codon:yes gene_type:complete
MLGFLINPNKFNKLTDIILKPLFYLTAVIFLIGLILIYYSPNDYQQGSTVRIMYIHVPSAWLALLTYSIMTIYSIFALAFRIPFGFIINSAVAPIGAVFTLVCLVSGSLWGKPMWGTWWVWDARLTSVAILFIVYLIIIFINYSFEKIEVKEKIIAIFVVIGSINLPIIKFSVDWWNTLHQPASISKLSSPSIDPSMLKPLIAMTLAFTFIGLIIAILRIKTEIILRKKSI